MIYGHYYFCKINYIRFIHVLDFEKLSICGFAESTYKPSENLLFVGTFDFVVYLCPHIYENWYPTNNDESTVVHFKWPFDT